MAKQEKKVTH